LEEMLDYAFLKRFLLALANKIMNEKDHLNKLDAACGDGDFGVGMYLGFKSVQKAVEEHTTGDISALLSHTGSAILSSFGGASGPVFGTFFAEMGEKAKGKSEIQLGDLATMLEGSLEGICLRGKAKVGDKTLVDALEPAVKSLRESVSHKTEILPALQATVEASKCGCESTADLVAKHGKARYLGEQAVGHIDPGAYVVQIIFETLLSVYKSGTLQD
jgi:phosphoenolpyruvate---glycerone phosphotransferase subunit DhaL